MENLSYQDVKPSIIEYLNQSEFDYNDNKPNKEGGWIFVIVNGVTTSYYITGNCFRSKLIYFEDREEELTKIYEALSSAFLEDKVIQYREWVDVKCPPSVENYALYLETIESLNLNIPEESIELLAKTRISMKGVNFEGTVFDRIKERGATIGGKFGKLVCDASEMDLFEMHAEAYYSCGEIDGVEKDPISNSAISIYECQAGIHHGGYLDDIHLNKALGKYLYDPEIIPTVKKVVILAGGYSEDHMNFIRERSSELLNRENPIEVVLLKTEREGNEISVVRVPL